MTDESAPRASIRVVIPMLDEERAIGHVLDAIPAGLVEEIIVVDNGSHDGGAAVASSRGARVVNEPERGYGAACLKGIAALAEDTDIVVFLDADFSDFPEDMTALVSPILADTADLVIGSRMLGGRGREVLVPQAYWGNRLAVTLIRLVWGHRYTDLGPFRAIRKDALDRLGMRDRNFGWTVEMQIRALESDLRVVERPVRYRKRVGASKISGTISGTIRAGAKILSTVGAFALDRWLRE